MNRNIVIYGVPNDNNNEYVYRKINMLYGVNVRIVICPPSVRKLYHVPFVVDESGERHFGMDEIERFIKWLRGSFAGLTYPSFLGWKIWGGLTYRLWKKFLCTRDIHLFDECQSMEHILHCDACGLCVHIALIETEEEGCNRAEELKYIETLVIEKSELDSNHCVQVR